jgi:serine/threonine protein kinase/type II secretory pathway predicted ATPase ExeA
MTNAPVNLDPKGQGPLDLSRLAGVKLGNYRLERVLGRGRMGVVYLAQDEALLRPTAIKVLAWANAEARGQDPVQWFLGEARLVARINDPRVVQIYGAAKQGEYCYIAMEYVAGQSTEALIAKEGRLPPDTATDILVQAASALHAAHVAGVVHRDVKPGNLLIGPGGMTKLGDFGMAHGSAGVPVGNASVRAGTPFYTAPEIWRGAVANEASDIYSLGATYFHLLTGRPPFVGTDLAAVERAHLTAPIPDPRELVRGLPNSCASLVMRALAKNPSDRQPSAQVLMWEGRRALQELATDGHATAPPKSLAAPPARPPSPKPPAVRPAPPPLADRLQFSQAPFGPFDPAVAPFQAAPLDVLRRQLRSLVEGPGTALVALTGPTGSGRSTLLRQLAGDVAASGARLVLLADGTNRDDGQTALQRICRAAGVPDEGATRVDGLLHRLGEERGRPVPLLILDGLDGGSGVTPDIETLASAALWSHTFKLVVAGAPGLCRQIASEAAMAQPERCVEIPVPPLDADQVAHYVRSWLRACRAPGAPPIHLSADALLLVAHRSGGRPGVIDVIAWNMLALAAASGRPTVTSWQAWAASADAPWPEARAPAKLVAAPPGWPTLEARVVIDTCRRTAGLPPWPVERPMERS